MERETEVDMAGVAEMEVDGRFAVDEAEEEEGLGEDEEVVDLEYGGERQSSRGTTLALDSADVEPLAPWRRATLAEERYVLLGVVLVAGVVLLAFGGGLALFFFSDSGGDSGDASAANNGTEVKYTNRTIVLVSVDALRWEYLEEPGLAAARPTLDRLIEEGASSRMQPVFPSSTFPNHYSIVTGLYPESHGIVANNMYDPSMQAYYSIGDASAVSDPAWYEAEALWTTIQTQGKKTGSMFWPGNTVAGMEPTYTVAYQETMAYSDRVDQVLSWMDLPVAERPQFYTLYLEGVDHAGHAGGVSNANVSPALAAADAALAQLMDGIEERRSAIPDINVIIVSDHGMTDISEDRVVLLDAYIDLVDDCEVLGYGSFASIYPKNGRGAQLLYQLQDADHMTVYGREDIPERYHYQRNDRIPDVLAVADEGWCISSSSRPSSYCSGGAHGYDNELESMAAVFIGHGEYFRKGYRSAEAISNLDVYSLLARSLGCTANANNGTWTNLFPLMA